MEPVENLVDGRMWRDTRDAVADAVSREERETVAFLSYDRIEAQVDRIKGAIYWEHMWNR